PLALFSPVCLSLPYSPLFRSRDDPLGGVADNGTLGGEGCAVAAAAMVFKFYGIDVDPQQLNWFLTSVGGYTDRGWLYWDRAAWRSEEHTSEIQSRVDIVWSLM